MVEFRRQALSIVLAALASLAATAQALPQAAPALRLELTKETGGLRLVNSGSEPLMIRSAIAVEKEEGHDWVSIATEYHAVAQCGPQSAVDPVDIAPGARSPSSHGAGLAARANATMYVAPTSIMVPAPSDSSSRPCRGGQRFQPDVPLAAPARRLE
jgi:hypothetical protein